MKKLSPKLQHELIEAGHLISLRGRFFVSLDALAEVSGTPIVPEPDEPPAPPPSKRDRLVAEREAQHAQQAAELEAASVVQAEQEPADAGSRATGGSADGDRSQDRDSSKG